MQAGLFNKPRTGFNVMSASDAVGMGLNLNIRCLISASASYPHHCNNPTFGHLTSRGVHSMSLQ